MFDCIKVVTYVRRQDGFASSLYEQSVKSNGFAGHLQYPIRKALTPDYANILSNWASLVKGRGELIVCPYEKQQFCGGNIYADFFHRVFDVDLDISQCKVPSGNPNPRLDRDALEFKRLLNICSDLQQGAVFLGGLLSYSEKREPETTLPFITRSLLSPDQKRELCLQFEESNAEVARGYLGREDGRLFYESLPALDTPWEVYSGLRREKMGEIIVFWKNERPELIELLDKVLKSIPNDAPEEDVSSLRMMQDMMK
ncbi:MAG: hypothetical protein HN350_08350 [Phycisphaerales bacterium]|nr:hypothetical protein [Phycisphaerales bacterium]